MPARPAWHARLPQIRAALARLTLPVLDRGAVERLFGLRRREAIRLMNAVVQARGGRQAGRATLVDREALAAWLDAAAAKRPVGLEVARRHRLEDALAAQLMEHAREAGPRSRPVILPAALLENADGGWPEGVEARPGELRIRFSGAEDLLGRVLALTEAIAQNPDLLQARLLVEEAEAEIAGRTR